VKAMEAVKTWRCSRDGLLGVKGAERMNSDGGNWGDPPRPKRSAIGVDNLVL